jgi:dipeptidyl aminopeptidase/acylaminoacyl peptidase
MLQAEADLRCPPQDNEQFFIALRHLGRTVEYVLYPEESHVYSSSGRPDRRIDRQHRMLDWFDRYLRD